MDLPNIVPKNDDERFMIEALKEAHKAFQIDEVPIGAVLVRDGKVISRGHNQVELLKDATAHAEMLCLTAGASVYDNWRLLDSTLYCTIEPCCMCAGAMLLSRIKTLVWGAPDIRHGANGSWIDLFSEKHPMHNIEIRQDVLKEHASLLLTEFFKKQRK